MKGGEITFLRGPASQLPRVGRFGWCKTPRQTWQKDNRLLQKRSMNLFRDRKRPFSTFCGGLRQLRVTREEIRQKGLNQNNLIDVPHAGFSSSWDRHRSFDYQHFTTLCRQMHSSSVTQSFLVPQKALLSTAMARYANHSFIEPR